MTRMDRHVVARWQRWLIVTAVTAVGGTGVLVADDTALSMTTRVDDATATAYISDTEVRVVVAEREDVVNLGDNSVYTLDHRERTYRKSSLSEAGARFTGLRALDGPGAITNPMVRALNLRVTHGGARVIQGYHADEYIIDMGGTARPTDLVGTWPNESASARRPLARYHVWITPELAGSLALNRATQLALIAVGPSGKRLARVLAEVKDIPGVPVLITTETMAVEGRMAMAESFSFAPASPIAAPSVPPADYRRVQ